MPEKLLCSERRALSSFRQLSAMRMLTVRWQ